MYGVGLRQPQADFKCFVYINHYLCGNRAKSRGQSALVYGADLFAKSYTITSQAAGGIDFDVSWERLFAKPRGNGDYNCCRRVAIADIVLHNEYGTVAALFATLRGREGGIIYLTAQALGLIVLFHCMYSFL